MAQKKNTSKAGRVAATSKKNSSPTKSSAPKKKTDGKKGEVKTPEQTRDIPVRLISSLIFLALFILFLVIFINPDGAFISLVHKVVLGLFGKVAFYASIPGFLYLFFIHAFSGKRPIILRSICVGVFLFLCGIFHGMVLLQGTPTDALVAASALYQGGISGEQAGFLCGGLTTLLRWLLGEYIPYILLVISGILTLLGSMQITIASIVRAIRNRPRADWEEEDEDEEQEPDDPASMVVNHFANRRIEQMERRRAEQESAAQAEGAPPEEGKGKKPNPRVDDMMRQIDPDVESPRA